MILQMLMTSIIGDRRAISGVVIGDQRRTEELAALMEEGKIWPVLGAHFSLDETVQAHAAFENDRIQGAVTVQVCATARYPQRDVEDAPAVTLLRQSA